MRVELGKFLFGIISSSILNLVEPIEVSNFVEVFMTKISSKKKKYFSYRKVPN